MMASPRPGVVAGVVGFAGRSSVQRWVGLFVLGLACAVGGCGDDDGGDGRSADGGGERDAADTLLDASSVDASYVSPGAAAGNEQRPAGVAHCYSALSGNHAATSEFWTAFRGGELERRAAAIAALAAASEEHPDEEEFALLAGLANLWRVAEPLPEQVDDMAGFIAAALQARSELERAYALCPTDHRIPAWLGPILVNQGRALMDEATVQEGLTVLQQGIDHYPSFVLFSKLLVYANQPKDDPDFRQALDAIRENLAICEQGDPACSNHPHAAHNVEGASVFLGDVYAKAGDREAALSTYMMVHESEQLAQWDYHALLQQRLETLDARIAAYDDDDPDNDPVAAWSDDNQCSICHRQ
jgi:tetratricopeptide (TPR) repeat protein